MNAELSPQDFEWIAQQFEALSGIQLTEAKAQLVVHRLVPRARQRGLDSLSAYCELLRRAEEVDERALLVDFLTTHETYFFREPQHFETLRSNAREWTGSGTFRVWSAACSTGEEASSAAFVLAESPLAERFEIVASDISPETVRKAEEGFFPLERAANIRPELTQKYCLRGVGDAEGTFRLNDALKARLSFCTHNLLVPNAALGAFDVIFLRNVLIYFDDARRRQIVRNVMMHLKPGGLFLPGHAESIRDCSENLVQLAMATYRFEPGAKSGTQSGAHKARAHQKR